MEHYFTAFEVVLIVASSVVFAFGVAQAMWALTTRSFSESL
jgi:hypothetical protein